jgi:hypothetical protein
MKKFLFLLPLFSLLVSCGKNDDRPMKEYISAFLNENNAVAAFGKADLDGILEKAEYKNVPKLGLILKKEIEGMEQELNTKAPIYFAFEGPFAEDGTPETSYLFLEVKNADSLEANIISRGYDVEKKGDLSYHASGDVAFGFKNNLLVLVTKKKEFDGEKLTKEAFEKVTGDISGGKIDDILSAEGDLVMGISVENLYGTSNTDLQNLSKEKQKQLQEMVADSYVMSTLEFQKGAAVFETRNLFSDGLAKRMFFKNDDRSTIRSALGSGEPRIGISANLDMKKMQAFMNEFSPNAMKDLAESIGGPAQFALMAGGDEALSNVFSGQLGAVMVGEAMAGGSLTPDFNFFVGLNKDGRAMAETFKIFLEAGMAQVKLDEKGLSGYSNAAYVPVQGKKITIPSGCEMFGKKGLTLFLNLDGLDMKQFDFEGEEKLIHLVKYATFEMDNSGSRLYLKARDDNKNAMKQIVQLLYEELADEIAGISL